LGISVPDEVSHEVASRLLTVKLRGRALTSDRRRGPTISPGTRGAKPQVHHGPLQRLLEARIARQRFGSLQVTFQLFEDLLAGYAFKT